jgi:hypothetical protein
MVSYIVMACARIVAGRGMVLGIDNFPPSHHNNDIKIIQLLFHSPSEVEPSVYSGSRPCRFNRR